MTKDQRQKYSKPTITKIKLDAKTAVLAVCKIAGGAGPHPIHGCSGPTPPCSAVGS